LLVPFQLTIICKGLIPGTISNASGLSNMSYVQPATNSAQFVGGGDAGGDNYCGSFAAKTGLQHHRGSLNMATKIKAWCNSFLQSARVHQQIAKKETVLGD
jgi:hypothetical protein